MPDDRGWATAEDVKSRWIGSAALPEDTVIDSWLDDARTVIEAEYPDLDDRLSSAQDNVLSRRVVYVQRALVMQALANPDGVRQAATTTGPFSEQITYGTETLSQAMALTAEHRAMLSPGAGGKAFQIDMVPKPAAGQNLLAGAWVNGPDHFAPGWSL